jgi:hypothetical protein
MCHLHVKKTYFFQLHIRCDKYIYDEYFFFCFKKRLYIFYNVNIAL